MGRGVVSQGQRHCTCKTGHSLYEVIVLDTDQYDENYPYFGIIEGILLIHSSVT